MDRLLSYREAANFLGITYDAMRKQKERHPELQAYHLGSKVYFKPTDLIKLFK